MKRFILAVPFLLGSLLYTSAQTNNLEIPFNENKPVIDGSPDSAMNSIQWHNFRYIEKSDSNNPNQSVRYKIVYNLTYLYIIIESDTGVINIRDRAYQNGDGIHLVIAGSGSGNPANEFYVLKFSPADPDRNLPALKSVWYYNMDLSGKLLGSETSFVCSSLNKKSYFELLLPWSEIYPYNPFSSDKIGFNICFVKAIGENQKNYYLLKKDNRIQSELSKREYLDISFRKPEIQKGSFLTVYTERNNITIGNTLKAKIVWYSPVDNLCTVHFIFRPTDKSYQPELNKTFRLAKGQGAEEITLPANNLSPGNYTIVWNSSGNFKGEIPFTILPEMDIKKEQLKLADLKTTIPLGDYNTLRFALQEIFRDRQRLKKYETAEDIHRRFLRLQNTVNNLKVNKMALSDSIGIFRRAFLSKIDGTLQPYTIGIPENFDHNKRYPLFVMLHGSGTDDQKTLQNLPSGMDYIQIAPKGRGVSNCFTADGAEIDVKEAIDDAIINYPVDTSKILIAGFSMGGYGACRIFYEYPWLFKGVIIFSGHPSLASKWLGIGYPDFLDPHYLKPFRNIPVFIYHCENDLNCPYPLTLKFAEMLRNEGADVELVTSPDGGHGILGKQYLSTYFKWQKKVLE